MRDIGLPSHLHLIETKLKQQAAVRIAGETSDILKLQISVRYGCIPHPYLLNICTENVIITKN